MTSCEILKFQKHHIHTLSQLTFKNKKGGPLKCLNLNKIQQQQKNNTKYLLSEFFPEIS